LLSVDETGHAAKHSPLRVFGRVLSEAPRSGLALMLALMLAGSMLDGVGILLLVPMLESLNQSSGAANPVIEGFRGFFGFFGLDFSLEGLLIIFFVLVVLRAVLTIVRARQNTQLQNNLVDKVRHRCYRALMQAKWRWLVAGRRSDHATALMSEVDQVSMGLFFGVQLIGTAVTMLAYLAAAFSLSWMACLISMATGLVIFFLLKGLRSQALHLGQRMAQAERAMMGNVQESLAGIKLAKILGAGESYLGRFEAHMQAIRDENLAFQINQTRATALYQVTGSLLLACFLYLGIKVLAIPMATLLTLVFIFSRLLPMFSSTQQQYQYWLHALPSVERCYQLIEQAESHAEPSGGSYAPIHRVEHSIELSCASIRYISRIEPALNDVSLTLKSRTTTAVMGESGAGKSTLADVLMGLLDLDAGQLCVDGHDISGPALLNWRNSVSYVPQDAFLFHDSIRRNLLWGDLQATDQELELALQRAAAEFVFELPLGLDTVVGDGGILLSGGERQRIALARALLKKPALLILDEATSALDRGNETRIRKAIENLHGNLTVLIIGHRLPTLEHADHIVVMDKGRIKVQGTWQEIADCL
jgi:ATP-binding cassette subfamily C protein